ncbi:MAG: DegV family protein [Clostridia bacterium]|nr:DegV family protein [Clostridia bacterium]
MSVTIIIDSTADLTPEIKQRMKVVPLTVCFGDEEYVDGVTITHRQFYEKLIETDTLPHTSQATPNDFDKVFKEVTEAGDSAVVLMLSSTLSGTYQSARLAAAEYENIYVVDTQTAAIGGGILAELAIQMADGGLDAKSIAERIEEEKKNICLIAMVGTLEYLKRGGRISKTVAFAGELLNIKPVISLKDGEIVILGKARGSKHGSNLLVTEIEKAGGVDFEKPILLGYTGLSDIMLQKYIVDSARLWENGTDELRTTPIGSVIGTHAGPGAIAVAFFKK